MKTTNNFFSLVAKIMAALFVFVLVGLTSCAPDDDIIKIDGGETPTPTPTPEDKVKNVTVKANTLKGIVWNAENATIIETKASYDAVNRDAYVHAKSTFSFESAIEWTSGKFTYPAAISYTTDNYINVFGKNLTYFYNNVNVISGAPEVKTASVSQGKAYTWTWSGGLAVTLVTTQESSRSTISVEGKTFTLDQNSIKELNFKSISVYRNDRDSADCIGYAAKVIATAKLSLGTENTECDFFFIIPNIWKKDGSTPTPDPELADYGIRDNVFQDGATKGKGVAIYSDGSEKDYVNINTALNNSLSIPQDITMTVSSLDWNVGNTSFRDLYQTGSTRNVQLNSECYITIASAATSITTSTDRASMTFVGNTEIPTIVFPNGKKVALAHGQYTFADRNVSEVTSSATSVTLAHKASATFTGASTQNISANVTLNLSVTPTDEELSFTVIRKNIENGYLKLEVSVNYSKSGTKTEYESLYLNAQLTADERKETTVRSYTLPNPSLQVTDQSNFNEQNGKFTGTCAVYSVPMTFPGFSANGVAQLRNKVTYTRKSGSVEFTLNPTVFQNGTSLGTTDLGNEQYYMYNDIITLALAADGTEVASAAQHALYKEEKAEQDVDFIVSYNEIEFLNGVWTGVIRGTHVTSHGSSEMTITAPYVKAGVVYNAIADVVKNDNSVTHQGITNNGAASTTYRSAEGISYTTVAQPQKSAFAGFSQNLTVTNESATTVIAGKTLQFKGTALAVSYVNFSQSEPTTSGIFNVYATVLNYKHGMNNRYDNATSNVNIKVEKPVEAIEINVGELISAHITDVYYRNTTDRRQVITVVGKGGVYVAQIDGSNLKNDNSFAGNFTFSGVPTACPCTEYVLAPADLIFQNTKDWRLGWSYVKNGATGTSVAISHEQVLSGTLRNPVLSEDYTINANGVLTITYGDYRWAFKAK